MKTPAAVCAGLAVLSIMASAASAQDLYCGDNNCYDGKQFSDFLRTIMITLPCYTVLGVTRESPRAEISKSYRKLAGKWHPDRFQRREEKEEAEKTFLKIAAAYDVLKDEESREEYNYMLDHPEEMWQNYYRYYRRRMAPKVRGN